MPTVQAHQKLETYMEAAVRGLDARLQDTIRMMSQDRRLLALRNYLLKLRADSNVLATKWVWTQAEANTFWTSTRGVAMRREMDAIIRHFNAAQPGYTLHASAYRTLQEQVHLWDQNRSVPPQCRVLNDAVERELGQMRPGFEWETPPYLEPRQSPVRPPTQTVQQPKFWMPQYPYSPNPLPANQNISSQPVAVYPSPPSPASLEKFKTFLCYVQLTGQTSNATPGFSKHGRCRAVDFTVKRGTQTIAGQSTSTAAQAWDAPGWTAQLQQAVQAGGPHFEGPLRVPGLYEPWHYTYR